MFVFLQGGMDYGLAFDLKFARFLCEACAELGWKILSLWQDCYSLLSFMLFTCAGAWAQELHETTNGTSTK